MFKTKTRKQIEEKAALRQKNIDDKQRLKDEEDYYQKLLQQKKIHGESLEELENYLVNECNKQVAEIERKKQDEIEIIIKEKDEIIDFLKNEIKEKENIIKDTQNAWKQITDVIPKLMSLTSILRVDAEQKKLKVTNEFQKYANYEDNCQALFRVVDKITPSIEKLLHMED